MSLWTSSRTLYCITKTSLNNLSKFKQRKKLLKKPRQMLPSRLLARPNNKWPIWIYTSHLHLSFKSSATPLFSTTNTKNTRRTWPRIKKKMLRPTLQWLIRFHQSATTVTKKTFQIWSRYHMHMASIPKPLHRITITKASTVMWRAMSARRRW